MKQWFLRVALVLGIPLASGAAGLIVLEEKALPNTPAPPGRVDAVPRPPLRQRWLPLERVSTKATVRIQDQLATVSMEQEFYNPNAQTCEGTFLFPVPSGAHLDRFVLNINGKDVDAELLSAEKARTIYEDIVRRAEDPALLEYVGRDVFKVRLFPIEGHARREIKLSYTQLLREESGLIGWVLPMRSGQTSQSGAGKFSLAISLESAVPIKTLYSPSHKLDISRQGDRKAMVRYESADADIGGDLQLYFSRSRSEMGLDLLTYRLGDEDGYFLLLANPEVDTPKDRIQPKDLVFVLDASGSMAGGKLEQAKKALRFCIETLNDQDRFQVLRFATEVEPAFNELRTASKENRAEGIRFVDQIRSQGGTAIHDALMKALGAKPGGSARPFVVVFLTDGLPTVGVTHPDAILKAVTGGASAPVDSVTRIFCFGIGTDVNTHLLDQIAEFTKASSTYVLPTEDLEVKLSSFYSRIKDPALGNVSIAFPDGVRVNGVHPNPLPDLYKGQQILVVGRYVPGKQGDLILSGTIQGEKRQFKQSFQFPEKDQRNEWLPRLWATRRVGYLLDEIRLRGESSELKDEVVALAKKYAIVTPYTAYLVSEDEVRRGVSVQNQLLKASSNVQLQVEYRKQYEALTREKSGDMAVAGARSFQYLREASAADVGLAKVKGELAAPSATSPSSTLSFSAAQVGKSVQAAAPAALADSSPGQARFVKGKSFFQKGDQWMDAESQSLTQATPIRIQFGSPEYFEWIRKNPEAVPWLSLGRNLLLVVRGQLYSIQ